jgi:hypothetical protein
MKRFILSIAVIAAMLFGSLAVTSSAEARPWGYRGGFYGPRAYYGYGYRPYYYGNYYGYRPYYGGYYGYPRYNYGYPGYYGYPRYGYGSGYGYYPGLRAGVYVY